MNELFPRETQTNIYRTLQECLTNIGKYAQASRLNVAIKRENGHVTFMVADNGRGFKVKVVLGDPTHRGLGLMAMQERGRMMGGTLEIRGEEGKGTRITLIIPVNPGQAG
ncbi:MAG: ATP-binding protein [Deltaproteobacteria bacterium]|nr:ATP-binding protein [Deltaproteobacteria bacterium]